MLRRLSWCGLVLFLASCDNVLLPKSYLFSPTEHFSQDQPDNRRWCGAAGCSGSGPLQDPSPPTNNLSWRIDPACRGIAGPGCHPIDHNRHDFVAVSLSGGGTKSSVFSGEVLFDMQALNLLDRVSMVSSVSGGSFAGVLYALSCDPGDCNGPVSRPPWAYQSIMRTLGKGNQNLLTQQGLRLLPPFMPVTMTINGRSFADEIEQRFLRDHLQPGQNPPPYTLADLNARRPPLYLNASIISQNRVALDDYSPNCPWLGDATGVHAQPRDFLARRTPDEKFHFAFSKNEFRGLGSDYDSFPLADGVAASAGFPALITPTLLRNYCSKDESETIQLVDGGNNDNQGTIEPYIAYTAFALGQRRYQETDCIARPANPNCMHPDDTAFFFIVNSAVTEDTGLTSLEPHPHFLWEFIESLANKALDAVDTYSAEAANLRGQLYRAQAGTLPVGGFAPTRPIYVSLLGLDQYALGGSEAAGRAKAGIDITADGHCPARCQRLKATDSRITQLATQIQVQSKAYDTLMTLVGHDGQARHARGLSDYHPQCYYDIRTELDTGLASTSANDQACLREAARWSMMLGATELCQLPKARQPKGLDCTNGVPAINMDVLSGDLPGKCHLDVQGASGSYAVLATGAPQDPIVQRTACGLLPGKTIPQR